MPDEFDALFGNDGRDFEPQALGDTNTFLEVWDDIAAGIDKKNAWRHNPAYMVKFAKFTEAMKLLKQGRLRSTQLQEVLTTSDFPILFGDILDRRLLNQYQITPGTWASYAARGTVADFRQSRIIAIDGLQAPFTPSNFKKPEGDTVKDDNNVTETGYVTQVQVYERGYSLSWRMFVNRALNFIDRFPVLLANGARRTESKFATSLFTGSAGPNATFFAAGNRNLVKTAYGASVDDPKLSIRGIRDALNVMYSQVDSGGDPIAINGVTLVVPPLLQITAQEILQGNLLEIVPATSALGTRIQTPNWASNISLAVEWYLPIVQSASSNKQTTWFLFANPTVGRPAMELTFLEGYDTPSFWQKAPNTMRMGGAVDPMMGDFNDSSQHYKCMIVIGGVLLDPKSAVVSLGINDAV